jgi:hypothetical protein
VKFIMLELRSIMPLLEAVLIESELVACVIALMVSVEPSAAYEKFVVAELDAATRVVADV